uniref:Chromosome 3 open reading frame 38 n=1 Tax=Astyanax mexicanus TaxID=7994 RepID=A0A3B1J2P6_ASTMX
MAAMSEKEQSGCRRLLELLSAEDLMALKDTVTNRLISVESTRAVEAIIAYSQSAEELLKRRKVHREVIFQYLAKEGVAVPPNTEKLHLVRRTLALWSDKDGLGDLTALGKEFCRWFYQLFNSLNPTAGLPVQDWGPQHFWGDAKLFILSCTGEQEQDEYYGAELVSRRLSALVWEEKLIFCPNLEQSGLKCLSTPHGLVLVAVAGTIHRENLCLGIFEQVFGLIRDPLEGNRWKMKYVHLKIKG